MIKKLFTLLITLGCLQFAVAQQAQISGIIQDSMNVRPISFVTVSLIKSGDSVLQQFTRTNQQGKFNLSKIPYGKYIMLIAHSNYVDYVDEIQVQTNEINLGTISLFERGQLLKEIVIKNAAGIKIKGDTLEFLADSFKVKQGAMVEDLLKVLPGIQVNKKGEITAQGEKIEKVLVDGEEFFGDDPTIATQNIQSKVVEKVQVFEQKSEQAKFTGFDDGQEQKTINLKLKKGMNKGEFGKVEAKAGPNDRWEAQGMFNSFKDKRQFSMYGVMSSLGKTGLGWEDRRTYTGTGNDFQMDDEVGFIWNSNDDEDDNSWGSVREGLVKAWTGGIHFADKWDENKQHINANYSFGRINTVKRENSFTENLLPNFSYHTLDTSSSFSSKNTHRISAKYEFMPDSFTNIIYNMSGRLGFNEGVSSKHSYNESTSNTPISSTATENDNSSTTTRVNNQLTINRKLRKAGRTISLNTNYNYNKNDGLGFLQSNNSFLQGGSSISQQLDQQKDQQQITNYLNADLTYTEPIVKNVLMKLSYSITSDQSKSVKTTLAKLAGTNDYGDRIDSLSSDFDSKINSHTGGLEFKFTQKKHIITLGSRIRYSTFNQIDLVRNKTYDYNRWNVFPTLRYTFKKNQFSRVTFTYTGSTKQPSITQIQPVQDNTNPLQVYLGNPNLKIGYNQNFNVNYFNYKVMTSRSIYSGLNFTNTYNMISINRFFDETGRTINQYININGFYSMNAWAGYGRKLGASPFEGRLDVNGSYTHTPSIINNIQSITHNYSVSLKPNLSYSIDEKLYTSATAGVIYTDAKNTIQTNRNIQFLSLNPTAEATYTIAKDFEINADIDYLYNPAVGPYKTSFSRFLLGAYVAYKMLPNRNLTWKLSVFDALNQNKGYDRSTTNNYNTERNYLTYGRYVTAGLVWNFTSGPMAAAQGAPKMGPRMPRGPRPGGGGGRRAH